MCDRKQLIGVLGKDKQATIVIRKSHIMAFDDEVPEARGVQCRGIAGVETLRAGRPRAIAENRETNLPELRRVTVRTPDNDSNQMTVFSLERGQIADAAFVESAAIVDYENVAGSRALHCLQKNIDASKMSDRQRRASETLIRHYRPNAGRAGSEGNFQPYSSVRNQRRRK